MPTQKKSARGSAAATGGASKARTTPKTTAKGAVAAKSRLAMAGPKAVATKPKAGASRSKKAVALKKSVATAPPIATKPATKSATRAKPASSTKAASPAKATLSTKPKTSAKAKTATKAKKPRKGVVKSLVEKTGELLDTVVVAVTGAVQSLSPEPSAAPGSDAKAESPGTGEIVGEVAPGATLGAQSGVAKPVLSSKKGKSAKKKSSKR